MMPWELWLAWPENAKWTTLGADEATASQDVAFSLSRVQGGFSHICRTFLHTEMYLVTLGTWKGIFLFHSPLPLVPWKCAHVSFRLTIPREE